jgi:arsenate reductase
MTRQRVLFVCIHNSARSQMAEAWLRHLAGDTFEVESAGLEPGTLNPYVVQAMRDVGIDISCHKPKGVDELLAAGLSFDYVIAVCDKEAAERCPIFPGGSQRLHWSFADPSAATGDDSQKLKVAARVRDEIRSMIAAWLQGDA